MRRRSTTGIQGPGALVFAAVLAACAGPQQKEAEPRPVRAEVVSEVEVADASANVTEPAPEPAPDSGAGTEADALEPRADTEPCAREHAKGIPCEEPPPRSASDVARVVQSARSKFRDCYNAERKTRPTLSAKLSIRIIVGRDGSVKSATEQGSSAPDPALSSCVLDVIKKLGFDPASEETTLQLPLSFVPPPP